MSEQVGFVVRAEDGEVFGPRCLDGSIGKPIMVKGASVLGPTEATLVSYEVAPDGSSIAVTVDVPDGTFRGSMSDAYSVA